MMPTYPYNTQVFNKCIHMTNCLIMVLQLQYYLAYILFQIGVKMLKPKRNITELKN